MSTKFKVVVPSYNCTDWLSDCLQSLENQHYKNYEAILINDASTDPRQAEIVDRFAQRNGWKAVHNVQHQGAMANIVSGIRQLECEPEDVIFVLDGDDWLFNQEVTSKLEKVYATGAVDLTYGQQVRYPTRTLGTARLPITEEMIQQRSYRRLTWRFSQLRTFKYFLWIAIRDEDLRDSEGHYVSVACDNAMMYPMMEMVGRRFKVMDDILYVYNVANPLNDAKIHRKRQREIEMYIRQKSKYPLLIR